jgi:hypothetical protein
MHEAALRGRCHVRFQLRTTPTTDSCSRRRRKRDISRSARFPSASLRTVFGAEASECRLVIIDPPLSVRERLEARVARALGRLSPGAQLRLSGGTPVRVDGQELDPGIQLTLAAALRFRGGASMRGSAGPDATLAEVRSASRRDALALTARPSSSRSRSD